MRLTLIERQDPAIRCVPDLGIAHLLGQCRAHSVDVTLIQGSPETLKCLIDPQVFGIFSHRYADIVKERGESWFREFLRFNYDIATSNNISDKTNPEALNDLWGLATFMREQVWPKWLPGHLFKEISKTKPDTIGFSLWDFYDHPKISAAISSLIERVKVELDVPVIVGGPGTVTKAARQDIMNLFKPDFIVHHEGEKALIDVLDMVESGKTERKNNMSFAGYDGETKPIEDLDSLALPDFSQNDLDTFFLPVRVLPMMTSRGCPWAACAFCNHHATYKGYREHSAGRVAETIELYKNKYKTEMVMLHDETFTSSRARAIIDDIPEAYYYSYAYPKGFDMPLLKKMHEKGFRVLVWGVESGCQPVLNSMRKGTDINEVERIIRDAHSVGITNVAFILFGFPGETREQAGETVEFLKRNSKYLERHASTVFRLQENSPVWQKPELWGVTKLSGNELSNTEHNDNKLRNAKLGNTELSNTEYSVKSGMSHDDVMAFLSDLGKTGVKTSANTKYYMPGDSEFRPYFFMQVVYGEGSGDYPVRSGVLVGDTIWPSLLMQNVSRPKLRLDPRQKTQYLLCDGKHKADAKEFERYPYVVNYIKSFT